MSLCVLDTDIMTLYQHGHPRVVQQVLAHPPLSSRSLSSASRKS